MDNWYSIDQTGRARLDELRCEAEQERLIERLRSMSLPLVARLARARRRSGSIERQGRLAMLRAAIERYA